MDKSKKRALKKEYKTQNRTKELLNLVENNNTFIRGLAQIELGESLEAITKEKIETAEEASDLTERIYLKILEIAYRNNPNSKNIFNSIIDETIDELSPFLHAFYHTYLFESAINMGDIGKEFTVESELEERLLDAKLNKLMAAYQLMENTKMLALIKEAKSADNDEVLQKVASHYNLQEMNQHLLAFIKKNWNEFILE